MPYKCKCPRLKSKLTMQYYSQELSKYMLIPVGLNKEYFVCQSCHNIIMEFIESMLSGKINPVLLAEVEKHLTSRIHELGLEGELEE